MAGQNIDAGTALHSISAEFMKLVDIDHMSDFDQVVEFLKSNLFKMIKEVHGFDKLIIDNGKVMLNCPPAPEFDDSHGALLCRSLSEKDGPSGITLKREFKVHNCGVGDNEECRLVEIREDIVQASSEEGKQTEMKENVVKVSIALS